MTEKDRQPLPGPIARLAGEMRQREEQPTARRTHRVIPASLGAAVAVGLTVALVTFDTGGSAKAESAVNHALHAAVASHSVYFTSSMTIDVGTRQLEHFEQEGAIDFARRNYISKVDLGQAGGTIQQRRIGDRLYLNQAVRGHRGSSAQWLSIPLVHEPTARFASAIESAQFTDPLTQLAGLATTRSPVTAVGHKMIRRVRCAGYRLHTNLAAFLQAAGAGARQPAYFRRVGATITVWLDSQHRPVSITQIMAASGASISTIAEFSAYGAKVSVSAPDPSAVITRKRPTTDSAVVPSASRVFEKLLFLRMSPDS